MVNLDCSQSALFSCFCVCNSSPLSKSCVYVCLLLH
uniref:Uncharacterized protein n=1 Tax=Rhizophora mucronata TaxID=61149 RepID=A0A2P2MYI0_RHIMU